MLFFMCCFSLFLIFIELIQYLFIYLLYLIDLIIPLKKMTIDLPVEVPVNTL